MRFLLRILICSLLASWRLAALNNSTSADEPNLVELGSRRELFVDRTLIERASGLELRLHEPRDEGVAFPLNLPHEGVHGSYTTILHDGDLYRAYYRGVSELGPDGSENERTCYAESRDGRTWTKPSLGLFPFQESAANNIVLDKAGPATHNFCPMIDSRPGVQSNERYKAVGGTLDKLFAFVSADGIHWRRMQTEPIVTRDNAPFPHVHLFDSQNVPFWSESEGCYVLYFRVWDGVRRIARSTSTDFRKWTPAVLMQQMHDDGVHGPRPAPEEQIYTNQTSPYFRAPHIYIATAARFFEGRRILTESEARSIGVDPNFFNDASDSVFMTSRGGNLYDRTFLEGHIKPGIGPRNWVSRTNYPALNVVQTGPSEMSLYSNQDYAQPTAHVRRYSLRLDGFASLHAGAQPGELISRPFVFRGANLSINFATSAAGSVRIEFQRPDGTPLPGYTLSDCREQIGNEIERTVSWQNGPDVTSLSGQPVRFRIVMTDAELYAFQIRE